ncbi:MAG: holin family protein [Rickettsiales bacterium]|nr:holin family protein [Rickettsiales bacterium]
MITLLGSLLGFISSTFPDLLKLFRDASDKKHEITLLQMQMDFQAQGHQEWLEEINTNADIAESEALYKTYTTGISWVDALNGTVRPVIAYSFFILYAAVKIMHYNANLPWLLWTEEDQAIFAGIISFYFGQRAMSKLRSGK